MSFLSNLFKKPKPILTEEDMALLKDIKRKAYMEEAEKLMKEQGKRLANTELGIKKPKETF